ncbi:MAG: signal peptidase I [Akkermansiaceae bacterium]
MFAPAWKKNAKALVKGSKKFVDYKRDLLDDERIDEIFDRRKDLVQAIRLKDRKKVDEASKFLRAACDNALPRERAQGWFEENVEVMFVAIVIALGLRAYYLQPFRIPTGSMQPTLNGIIGTPLAKDEWPSLPQRMLEYALRGRSYVQVVNDRDRRVAPGAKGNPDIRDSQFLHFFSRSQIYFLDSKPLRLPAPTNPSLQIGLGEAMKQAAANGGVLKEGTVIVEGMVDSGDLVLVDKFSYHFRKPKRGEVFVFDTIGIRGIKEHSGPQGGGSHYIKRLVGVPGDELSIQTPDLLVDGKVAQEPGIQLVAEGLPPFEDSHQGYVLAQPSNELKRYLVNPNDVLRLRGEKAKPGMREYAAMGDNTGNSLDSRYWGAAKEFNLVGPAAFSLWPITTGHWGFIK